VNDAQNVTLDRACGKDHDQQNLSKLANDSQQLDWPNTPGEKYFCNVARRPVCQMASMRSCHLLQLLKEHGNERSKRYLITT